MRRNSGHGVWSIAAVLLLVLGGILGAGGMAASAAPAHAAKWKAGQLGIVRYILRGLTVTPPTQKHMKGKVQMPLFNQYGVRTAKSQKASIGFHDGTLIHLNSNTDALLASPSVTRLRSGEIQENLVPGTNHGIQTATSLGAANGTIVDVKINKHHKAVWTVVEGAVKVKTKKGSVIVKTNQQTTVTGQNKPSAPVTVNASQIASWSGSIPPPTTAQMNVALDANGGRIEDYSSQSTDTRSGAKHLIDGNLATGWSTAQGQVSNQWAKIGFGQNQAYNIGAVVVDPGATQGHSVSNDVKDFQVRVSTTTTDDASFSTVFSGTAKQQHELQRFVFPKPVPARYVEFVAVDNYGGTDSIDVAELEVTAYGAPITLPVPRFSNDACPGTADGCVQALLDLINATRAQNHLGPLTFNLTQSRGTSACVGSIGHTQAMASTGDVWNVLQGFSAASFPNDICVHSPAPGENIGFQATGNELTDLQALHADMMKQQHGAATCAGTGNSACNLLAPDFNQVGIGIVQQDGGTYVTEDFLQ